MICSSRLQTLDGWSVGWLVGRSVSNFAYFSRPGKIVGNMLVNVPTAPATDRVQKPGSDSTTETATTVR